MSRIAIALCVRTAKDLYDRWGAVIREVGVQLD
jgi:hypothetical protein